jgi:hypothetical protein
MTKTETRVFTEGDQRWINAAYQDMANRLGQRVEACNIHGVVVYTFEPRGPQ